jgi:hypothetical protein
MGQREVRQGALVLATTQRYVQVAPALLLPAERLGMHPLGTELAAQLTAYAACCR